MRVLLLTQYVHPEPFPINQLLAPLREVGADVTVLTGQPNYPDGRTYEGYRPWQVTHGQLPDGTPVIRLPTVTRGKRAPVRLVLNYVAFVVMASLLGPWLLRGQRFDAVLVYAPSPITQAFAGWVLARLKRAPLVTWVQDLWPESLAATGFVTNRRLLAVVGIGVRWLYRRHDLLLGQSNAFVREISTLAPGAPVAYTPNPGEEIDQPASAHMADAAGSFNVVFAGNLGTLQALDTILDAAELLRDDPEIRFTLVGSGSRSDWLASEVARRGLRQVHLPGRFSKAEMPAIFAGADALLVTLARQPILAFTIPSKLQSYLSAGRPVLGSLDGEGAELIRRTGAGLVSPAEDAPALAGNVRRLKAMSPAERASMGEAGHRAFRDDFHPLAVARLIVAQLTACVARRPLTFTS